MVQLDIYLQDPDIYLQDPRVKLNVAGLDYTLTSYILTYTKKNRFIKDKKVKLTNLYYYIVHTYIHQKESRHQRQKGQIDQFVPLHRTYLHTPKRIALSMTKRSN